MDLDSEFQIGYSTFSRILLLHHCWRKEGKYFLLEGCPRFWVLKTKIGEASTTWASRGFEGTRFMKMTQIWRFTIKFFRSNTLDFVLAHQRLKDLGFKELNYRSSRNTLKKGCVCMWFGGMEEWWETDKRDKKKGKNVNDMFGLAFSIIFSHSNVVLTVILILRSKKF